MSSAKESWGLCVTGASKQGEVVVDVGVRTWKFSAGPGTSGSICLSIEAIRDFWEKRLTGNKCSLVNRVQRSKPESQEFR